MPKIKTKEGFLVNYEVQGELNAKHTIIFSHGNGNCIKDWHSLGYVERLAPHFRLILMDALGYGASEKPLDPAQYTPERRAEDVIAVLDALYIVQADFFGASIGGSLGFVLADLYPKRFSSFIIGSAHPYGSSQPIGCNIFGKEFRDLMCEKGMEGFVNEMEEKYLKCRFREDVRVEYLKNDPKAMAAANTPEWPNRASSLPNIKVPVLLFAGDKDPVSQYQEDIAKKIKHAEICILSNTDHAGAFWESVKVAPLITNFLNNNIVLKTPLSKV